MSLLLFHPPNNTSVEQDALGYAVFFGVFDTAKMLLRRRRLAQAVTATNTALDDVIIGTTAILTAGAAAGAASDPLGGGGAALNTEGVAPAEGGKGMGNEIGTACEMMDDAADTLPTSCS